MTEACYEIYGEMMKKPEHIDKTKVVIRGFLALLDKRVSNTQIINLVYLADNLFYESTGRTVTGTQYMWDHYGPNSVGNTISDTMDKLVSEGNVCRAVVSYKGSYTFNYWVNTPSATWKNAASALSDGERQIVLDIARRYGRYNAPSLANLSKKTKPFQNARRCELLHFKQDERAKELQQWLDSIDGLREEVELGITDADAGLWIWDEELDAQTS